MKDTIFNLFVFLIVFSLVVLMIVGSYFLYLMLVPGGPGLIFASPYAFALWPSLIAALLFSQYRSVEKPGRFVVTYFSLAGAFFLVLLLAFPIIVQTPPIRSADTIPVHPGRFASLADGSQLYQTQASTVKGQFAKNLLFVPADEQSFSVIPDTQYDPLNGRFLFSDAQIGTRLVENESQERRYFEFPPLIRSVQWDFFTIYASLKVSWEKDPSRFYVSIALLSFFFMGLFTFFSLRRWPLIQVIVLVTALRLMVWYLSFCFTGVPSILSAWIQGPAATFWLNWLPLFLILLTAICLFFMTLLIKPHQRIVAE